MNKIKLYCIILIVLQSLLLNGCTAEVASGTALNEISAADNDKSNVNEDPAHPEDKREDDTSPDEVSAGSAESRVGSETGEAPQNSEASAPVQQSSSDNTDRPKQKVLNVPYISQLPKYPTGCEVVSAVMVLRTVGVFTDPEIFIKKYLRMSDFPYDPNESFCGDPREETGYGCFAPALAKSMNKALRNVNYYAVSERHSSMEELCEDYIDNNIPVVIWGSVNMSDMKVTGIWRYRGSRIEWKSPEHCLVLIGYNEDEYIFNDPLTCECQHYKKEIAEKQYLEMGQQAVVILPQSA